MIGLWKWKQLLLLLYDAITPLYFLITNQKLSHWFRDIFLSFHFYLKNINQRNITNSTGSHYIMYYHGKTTITSSEANASQFLFQLLFLATNLLFARNRVRGRNCLMIWKTCSISLYSETTEKRRQQRVQSANIDSSVTTLLSLNPHNIPFSALFPWLKIHVRFFGRHFFFCWSVRTDLIGNLLYFVRWWIYDYLNGRWSVRLAVSNADNTRTINRVMNKRFVCYGNEARWIILKGKYNKY